MDNRLHLLNPCSFSMTFLSVRYELKVIEKKQELSKCRMFIKIISKNSTINSAIHQKNLIKIKKIQKTKRVQKGREPYQ